MKLTIDVTEVSALPAVPAGWLLTYTPEDPKLVLAPRTLGCCGTVKSGFPLPPTTEAASWAGKAHGALCEATTPDLLAAAFQKLIVGQGDAAAMQQFGMYLTAVLLGPHLGELRKRPAGDPIELHLAIPSDAGMMPRLMWEMIYGDDRPLAADEQHPIGIVRVVKRQKQPPTIPLHLPLRVLFVIGQTIDDSIRPGAEYLAVLRRLATTNTTVDFNSRVLLRASRADLAAAFKEFSPSVVHFICHGDFDPVAREATLILTLEKNGAKSDDVDPLNAGGLLDLLREQSEDERLPSVIVLNACHTADAGSTADRKNAYRSFAAALVEDGIPVALGIAGEVADGACRLFTTGFYEALIAGSSVSVASARGRRAALRKYVAYHETIEWARPVLFVAKDAEELRAVAGPLAQSAYAAALFLRIRKPGLVFCGRITALEECEKLVGRVTSEKTGAFVLGFAVNDSVEKVGDYKPQFGKTRLLEEIAARLVLNGIAPILMVMKQRLNDTPPTAFEFVQRVGELANKTRERFGPEAKARKCGAALEYAIGLLGVEWDGTDGVALDIARGKVKEKLPPAGLPLDDVDIKRLISREAAQLVKDLAPFGIHHAALLVDDLHLCDRVVSPLLIATTTGDTGLGEAPNIVPLIFTYLWRDTANGEAILTFMNDQDNPHLVLKRFEGIEDVMTQRQFLLTRVQDPMAFTGQRDMQTRLQDTYDYLREVTDGLPSGWETSAFGNAIRYLRKSKLLVEANDEDILKQYG